MMVNGKAVKHESLADLRAALARLPNHPCAVQAEKTLRYAEAERARGSAENAKRLLRSAAAWIEDAAARSPLTSGGELLAAVPDGQDR